MLTVFIKALVPKRRQTACTKDLPARGLCCALYLVAPGSVLSDGGLTFCNCAGGWALVTSAPYSTSKYHNGGHSSGCQVAPSTDAYLPELL